MYENRLNSDIGGKMKYKYISTEDVERLISKITDQRDKALFSLMYLYGLRCIEAVSLNISDLRMRDSRLYVHAAKHGISGEVILSAKAKRALQAYLKERTARNGHCDALFLSRKSKTGTGRLSTAQVYRLFRKYAKKAKLPQDTWHPHVLRHSVAVHMADSGVDVAVVKEHLRHRKIDTTMIYFQITNKARHELQAKALSGKYIANL